MTLQGVRSKTRTVSQRLSLKQISTSSSFLTWREVHANTAAGANFGNTGARTDRTLRTNADRIALGIAQDVQAHTAADADTSLAANAKITIQRRANLHAA